MIAQFFPDNPDGDLWKAGEQPETNKMAPNPARLAAFWAATDLAAVSAIVDLPGSLKDWAGEALLNDADGYYGGVHNFYIYDQGAKGFVFLPNDTDSTFDWLACSIDGRRPTITRSSGGRRRAQPAPTPGAAWRDR